MNLCQMTNRQFALGSLGVSSPLFILELSRLIGVEKGSQKHSYNYSCVLTAFFLHLLVYLVVLGCVDLLRLHLHNFSFTLSLFIYPLK